MNKLSQLRKALKLANDQGMTIGLSFSVLMAFVIAFVFVSDVSVLAVLTALETVSIPNHELTQPDVDIVDLFTRRALTSPSPSKRV